MKSRRRTAHVGQECRGINTNPGKYQHPSIKVRNTKKKIIIKENKIIGPSQEVQEENDASIANVKGHEENLKKGLEMN